MNLTQQIPNTGRALGSYPDWQSLVTSVLDTGANGIGCPNSGGKLLNFLAVQPEVIDDPTKVSTTVSNDRDKLFIHARVTTGQNALTGRAISDWKTWPFSKDEVLALPEVE